MPEILHNNVKCKLEIVATAEQIQKRVRELARQISEDFQGRT